MATTNSAQCQACGGTGIDTAADVMVVCPTCKGTGEPAPAGDELKLVTCPGCSGFGQLTDDPQVLRCEACGGVFTATDQITAVQAIRFVAIHLPMVANAGADGQFYFDLELSDGRLAGRRVHGWADRKTKRVVQWG